MDNDTQSAINNLRERVQDLVVELGSGPINVFYDSAKM
jgi:hypothetical protein